MIVLDCDVADNGRNASASHQNRRISEQFKNQTRSHKNHIKTKSSDQFQHNVQLLSNRTTSQEEVAF
jgi:hypothetical protein